MLENSSSYIYQLEQNLNKLGGILKTLDTNSEIEVLRDILTTYKKCIRSVLQTLRRRLLYQHNLFISNPKYIIEQSYLLNLIAEKSKWLEIMRTYDYVTYLMPSREINYEVCKKISEYYISLLKNIIPSLRYN